MTCSSSSSCVSTDHESTFSSEGEKSEAEAAEDLTSSRTGEAVDDDARAPEGNEEFAREQRGEKRAARPEHSNNLDSIYVDETHQGDEERVTDHSDESASRLQEQEVKLSNVGNSDTASEQGKEYSDDFDSDDQTTSDVQEERSDTLGGKAKVPHHIDIEEASHAEVGGRKDELVSSDSCHSDNECGEKPDLTRSESEASGEAKDAQREDDGELRDLDAAPNDTEIDPVDLRKKVRSRMLRLPELDVVATDSECEIASSDHEGPLLVLGSLGEEHVTGSGNDLMSASSVASSVEAAEEPPSLVRSGIAEKPPGAGTGEAPSAVTERVATEEDSPHPAGADADSGLAASFITEPDVQSESAAPGVAPPAGKILFDPRLFAFRSVWRN